MHQLRFYLIRKSLEYFKIFPGENLNVRVEYKVGELLPADQATCIALGGYLAEIQSPAEQNFVQSLKIIRK